MKNSQLLLCFLFALVSSSSSRARFLDFFTSFFLGLAGVGLILRITTVDSALGTSRRELPTGLEAAGTADRADREVGRTTDGTSMVILVGFIRTTRRGRTPEEVAGADTPPEVLSIYISTRQNRKIPKKSNLPLLAIRTTDGRRYNLRHHLG
jgi:hypothetical protein